MSDSAQFALHRAELRPSLVCGERKIVEMFRGTAAEYRAGHVLIEADTDHHYVYRLISGWACRTRTLCDGRDQCILIFLPGDLFAVKSMFIMRHPDDVRVLSVSLIERIDYRKLHEAYGSDADIANRCIWQVIEEERRLHNWVVGLGQGNAEERCAMLLLDFHGRLVLSGTIRSEELTFQMPLTQVHLANHLGITAIHVSRVLRVLREADIALVRDGEVRILNLNKLAQIAGPLLDSYERCNPQYVGDHVRSGP
jgi:CRP/FNR family transcriptional regulator